MLPSSSSAGCIPDKVVVRDAALCLRSFCGERRFVPYSIFCERFKQFIGYSLKEHLQSRGYNFANVIEQISVTTRTKCRYDADQKMVQLLPEEASNEPRASQGLYPDVSIYESLPNDNTLHYFPPLPNILQMASERLSMQALFLTKNLVLE
ncbi:hypothetical protein OSTOST_04523 [Ostertagia ostertagi]